MPVDLSSVESEEESKHKNDPPIDNPEYVYDGAYQSDSEQSKISAYQPESEEEEEQDPKTETTEIIGRLDGLAHDLDVGVRGVSTPCKDTPTRRGNLFPEENAVINSNALPNLAIDTHIESNQASLDEPPAAPNTVFGRLGAMTLSCHIHSEG